MWTLKYSYAFHGALYISLPYADIEIHVFELRVEMEFQCMMTLAVVSPSLVVVRKT